MRMHTHTHAHTQTDSDVTLTQMGCLQSQEPCEHQSCSQITKEFKFEVAD